MQTSSVEHNRAKDRLVTGRAVCERCLRPTSACYCAHIRPVATKTRLVLLQHPRERYVAIGTARMASLCLTNSELHVGIDWTTSAPLARALGDSARPPILLYPGEGAIDIAKHPPPGPVTLVVVDGTWPQTKKVVRTNPLLSQLPRYAFVPTTPSNYRIRKEPDAVSVATIEALFHALSALEGDGPGVAAILEPFRAMIDFQIDCESRLRGGSSRHAQRRARVRRLGVPRVFTDRPEDIVCVAAEANSWPYAMRGDPGKADELVHWTAYRPATGETFSCVVAPKSTLAPGTIFHTGLDEPTLCGGASVAELDARWRGFVRDTDVICAWGHYETNLFLATGAELPKARLDLRSLARDIAKGPVGSLVEYRRGLGGEDGPAVVLGRAGRKLRALSEIILSFASLAPHAPHA
jgi:DTW domain-containing protein YfiP